MLPFPFYLTAIFTQVYHLYGTNSSISITTGETSIQLQWPVTDVNGNYFILYGINGNYSDVHNETVTMPTSNDTDVVHTISGLDPGQHYMIEVYKDGVMIFKDFIATRPLPVQNVQVSGITATSISLSWLPKPGSIQDQYKIYIAGITNPLYVFQSDNLTETSYYKGDLQPGQQYNVTVAAFSHGEPSSLSNTVDFNTAPLPPLTVTVDALDTRRLNVTWQPDTTTPQDSYRVGYLYNNTAGNEVEVNVSCQNPSTSFCEITMPGIPGQVYPIMVYSILGGVLSVPTKTRHSTIPLPVTGLQEVQANDSALHIQWINPNLTLTYFEKFIVMATSIFGSNSWNVSSDQNQMIITDLEPGTFYNISVKTDTGYETSAPIVQSFYTYPKQVSSLTYNPVFDATTDSFTAKWTMDNDTSCDNFIIDITPKPEGETYPITLPPTTFNYTFRKLLPGSAYNVSIATKLLEKVTDPVSYTFRTVPNKPSQLRTQVVTSNQVLVQWDPPDGGVDEYRLTLTLGQTGVIQKIVSVQGTSHSFIELQPGTQYSVDVASQSGGLYSGVVSINVTTDPASVESLQISSVSSYTITMTWTQPNSTNFDEYQLEIDPADANSPVRINRSAERSYTFSALKPGQLYTIAISTLKDGNSSETVVERAVTKPLPVENVKAVSTNSSTLSVTWSVNTSSHQSHFLVSYEAYPSSGIHELGPVSYVAIQTEYQVDIPDLFPGGRYHVMVAAWQNISGEFSVSELRETNATTMPEPVVNLTAALINGNTIQLDWSAPEESFQDHYVVRYRPSLRDSDASWVETSRLSTNFTLRDQFPGERYDIEVYGVRNDVRSEPQNISIVTEPLPPSVIQVLSANATTSSVVLLWIYNSSATFVESWIVSHTMINGSVAKQMVPRPESGSNVIAVIDGLTAGYQYSFSVKSVVLDMASTEVQVNATARPFINTTLLDAGSTNSTVTVAYTIEEQDYFDKFIFRIESPRITIERGKTDPNKVVVFTGLEAGALYTVEVQTVSGEQKSEKKVLEIETLPNLAIVSTTVTSYTITLLIQRPTGGVATYNILCSPAAGGAPVKNVNLLALQEPQTVEVKSLTPYTEYSCKITSHVSMQSNSFTLTVITAQAAPSAVQSLDVQEIAPNTVKLTWAKPLTANGEITHYLINYIGRNEELKDEGGRNISFTEDASITINNLKAGYTYTFYVRAKTTEVGESTHTGIQLRTYEPPYKDGVTALLATPKKASSSAAAATPYKLFFNFTNAFSDKYGEIVQYTVIVAEDPDWPDIEDNFVLPGWKNARQDSAVKAYQVISNCSDFFLPGSTCDGRFALYDSGANTNEYKVFEIGTETDCEGRGYCNGPLKPDTAYYIALRAYTTGGFKDTPFSDAVRTEKLPVPEEKTNVGGIVGGIVSAVVAIVIVVLVALFLRRRRASKSTMYRHSTPQTLSMTHTKTTSCALSDFKEYVKQMAADSDFKYAEQFEDLKDIGRNQASTAAELPCNRGKNRFTNILPYDHSRVKLLPVDDEEGSDYINANYIMGFNSKREYIVSQGPLPSTRDDFWRMLWEQNCRNIVMLTKCMEKGREKCDHYWPNSSDAVFYGDIQVAILNETVFPDWTITEFKVCLGDQTRQVRHFHFTAWPDFGVPKKPQSLVRFVRTVRAKLIKEGGPILVHCSAGVGRSGTFIVLDTLLQRIKTHETVDIFNLVAELRKERVWMVQTEQQYICIHQCLLCVLDGTEDEHIYDNVAPANVNVAFEDDEGVAMT